MTALRTDRTAFLRITGVHNGVTLQRMGRDKMRNLKRIATDADCLGRLRRAINHGFGFSRTTGFVAEVRWRASERRRGGWTWCSRVFPGRFGPIHGIPITVPRILSVRWSVGAREAPGPVGRTLWQKTGAPDVKATSQSKSRALIVIGTGHDDLKKGVRFKADSFFDKAALNSFAPYTKGQEVKLVHVTSAAEMKVIEGGPWDTGDLFGHGVENQMALAPKEMGKILTEAELAAALQKASVKSVYLFV